MKAIDGLLANEQERISRMEKIVIGRCPEHEKPAEVLDACCAAMVEAYAPYGFSYNKSQRRLSIKSDNKLFACNMGFGTSYRNQPDEYVKFTAHASIDSKAFEKWLEERLEKKPSRVLRALPYVAHASLVKGLDPQDETGWCWNMGIKYHRDERIRGVIHLLDTLALPQFALCDRVDELSERIIDGTAVMINLNERLPHVWENNPHVVVAFLCFLKGPEAAQRAVDAYFAKYPVMAGLVRKAGPKLKKMEKEEEYPRVYRGVDDAPIEGNRPELLLAAIEYFELTM